MKGLYAFTGCLAAAIIGMFLMNSAVFHTFTPTVTLIAGAVFGLIAALAAAVCSSPAGDLKAITSALTLGTIFLVFGSLAVLTHSLGVAEMIVHTAAMSLVGYMAGWGYHIGGRLHS